VIDSLPSPKKSQQFLFSKMVVLAELCLLPLLLLVFVLGAPLSRLVTNIGFDPNKLTNIWFLQEQSEFFAARGVDLHTVATDLQIFGAFVWMSVTIAVLRLLSGRLLFGLIDARAAVRRRPIPVATGKLLLGYLAAGPVAIWASMYGRASAPQLGFLLKHSPQAYVRLDAFVFVGGMIFLQRGCFSSCSLS